MYGPCTTFNLKFLDHETRESLTSLAPITEHSVDSKKCYFPYRSSVDILDHLVVEIEELVDQSEVNSIIYQVNQLIHFLCKQTNEFSSLTEPTQ